MAIQNDVPLLAPDTEFAPPDVEEPEPAPKTPVEALVERRMNVLRSRLYDMRDTVLYTCLCARGELRQRRAQVQIDELIARLEAKRESLIEANADDAAERRRLAAKVKQEKLLEHKKRLARTSLNIRKRLEKREALTGKLDMIIERVRDAKLNRDFVEALADGRKSLAGLMSDVSVERVDDLMADITEAFEMNDDVSAALAQEIPLAGVNDSDIEREFQALLSGEEDNVGTSGAGTSALLADAPAAPSSTLDTGATQRPLDEPAPVVRSSRLAMAE